MTAGSPVMIRIFKQESELELWMQRDGRFELFATYSICFWSGRLGPKLREGDRQAPEGLYSVSLDQLYEKGRRPRSFDIGFPNAFDRVLRAHGLLHLRAWRLHVDRLLRHDQSRHGRDLCAERARPARGPGPHRGARVPVPHDRSQPGGARRQPMACVLAEPQAGLRCLRAHPCAASGGRLRPQIHRRRGRPARARWSRRRTTARRPPSASARMPSPASSRWRARTPRGRSTFRPATGWSPGPGAAGPPGATCGPTMRPRGGPAWPPTPGAWPTGVGQADPCGWE